jgi:acyl-coenzyme A thioesterase PaaI-like protein
VTREEITMGDSGQDAIQDHYLPSYAWCYGCGRLNEHGLHLRTFLEGDETVTSFTPHPYHTGGHASSVYGGLIASVIDCHSNGTAAWAAHRAEGAEPGSEPTARFVTAALQVDYVRPTPIGETLEVRGRVKEMSARKVIVVSTVTAGGEECARGEVVAVRLRDRGDGEPSGNGSREG